MFDGQFVFSQLVDFLPRRDFKACVERYHGNYKCRGYSCRDQFLAMAFAQLTYRESLRDIEICLRALGPKLYHAGFRCAPTTATLACRKSLQTVIKDPVQKEAFLESAFGSAEGRGVGAADCPLQ